MSTSRARRRPLRDCLASLRPSLLLFSAQRRTSVAATEGPCRPRLYPVNFRDLPFSQQYKKYQWIEVVAEKHKGRDVRKESYRPDSDSVRVLGEPIPTRKGDWSDRDAIVLQNAAGSMEELWDQQKADRTSLGVFKPQRVLDLKISEDDAEWKPQFLEALKQSRLWDDRVVTKEPPRKVPFKFHYRFECDDPRCRGHRMMIEDWEVGALYWRLVDNGAAPQQAAESVRAKFLDELCGEGKETYFFVGTVLEYGTWVVIGVFYPKAQDQSQQNLF